jgi:hypothetical protein
LSRWPTPTATPGSKPVSNSEDDEAGEEPNVEHVDDVERGDEDLEESQAA